MAESSTIGEFIETRAARHASDNLEQLNETARRHLHWSDVFIICVALAALIGLSLHVGPAASRQDAAPVKVSLYG